MGQLQTPIWFLRVEGSFRKKKTCFILYIHFLWIEIYYGNSNYNTFYLKLANIYFNFFCKRLKNLFFRVLKKSYNSVMMTNQYEY